MDALVYSRTADINVKKVALADDFITGADLSSYIALKDSGVVFRDENGKPLSDAEFFSYLRDGGKVSKLGGLRPVVRRRGSIQTAVGRLAPPLRGKGLFYQLALRTPGICPL